jgi:DNA-binding Xre family transcriptional regulator
MASGWQLDSLMTQRQCSDRTLADALNLSEDAVWQLRRSSSVPNLSVAQLEQLCALLQCEPEALFEERTPVASAHPLAGKQDRAIAASEGSDSIQLACQRIVEVFAADMLAAWTRTAAADTTPAQTQYFIRPRKAARSRWQSLSLQDIRQRTAISGEVKGYKFRYDDLKRALLALQQAGQIETYRYHPQVASAAFETSLATAQLSLNLGCRRFPQLGRQGISRSPEGQEIELEEILVCRYWLSCQDWVAEATTTSPNSYLLKHEVQDWGRYYVSNGALIAAAVSLEIPVRQMNRWNAYIAIQRQDGRHPFRVPPVPPLLIQWQQERHNREPARSV